MSKKSKRRAMRAGSAVCPICKHKRPLVEHHIGGRDIADCDMPWNLAWVCSNCHDDIHSDCFDRIVIEGWIMTTSGKELSWYRKGGEKPDFLPDSSPHTY